MSKGRKNEPQQKKVLKGTFRHDRANPQSPEPEPDAPKSPTWLPQEAGEYFGILKERLDALNLASRSHTEMMALAAQRLAEIDQLNQQIREEGHTYKTTNTQGDVSYKPNPAVGQRNEAMRHLQSLLAEFGLSPASINKVSSPSNNNSGNKFGAL
jgi:P27 family predicted phage terminase small subunit